MANADDFWSDEGDDILDELPLTTLMALEGRCRNLNLQNGDTSDEDEIEEAGEEEQQPQSDGRGRWVRVPSGISKAPPVDNFQGRPGIADFITRQNPTTVLDFFQIFFTLDFISGIMTATNAYAEKVRRERPQAHLMKWIPVDRELITKFLALTMLMGIIKKAQLKEYWSTARELVTPMFSSIMKRDRFMIILRYINYPHLRSTTPQSEAQERCDWLFNHLNTISKSVYSPLRDICVDESMVPYKGRSKFVQYMPKKPHKWGLKVWVLAESVSGYILHAIPYYGRIDRGAQRIYEDIVLKLCTNAGVLGKGHHLYCDNYFSSVKMFYDFVSKFGTFCCGTLRKNRIDLPKDLMVKKHSDLVDRGSSIFSRSGNLLLVVWKDTKIIHVLTSIHGLELSTCTRSMKDKESGKFARKELDRPTAISEYSKFMGGVDLADQLYQYYCFARKTCKWTKKIFWYILELMKLNSYTMFNQTTCKPLPLYQYSVRLISELLTTSELLDPAPNRHIPDHPHRLVNRCMPVNLGNKTFCKVCYARFRVDDQMPKRQTKFGCQTCKVHLCIPDCFRQFHTQTDYTRLPQEE